MKRALLAALMAAAFGFTNGCCWNCNKHHCQDPCKPGLCGRGGGLFHRNTCHTCGESRGLFHHCRGLGHHRGCPPGGDEDMGYGAPASAQITYPYYTNRGPRDFLAEEPRGIGP